jgi:hypothetical protein
MKLKTSLSAKYFLLSLFVAYTFINISFAQATKPESKPRIWINPAIKKMQAQIDSLNTVISEYKSSYEKSSLQNKVKDSFMEEMNQKMLVLQNQNNDLQRKLSNYKGENLKLDQSNRILIIFNSIVGVLLLSTLIWFLRNIGKKKSAEKNKSDTTSVIAAEVKPPLPQKNEHQYFESKLEQLEKLGKLKEFARQKQQILGNT